MATSSGCRKPGQDLIDVVFSWSVNDVLNGDYYKDKVTEIPKTFSSTDCYTNSFVDPLLEETHADLLSKMKTISRASTRKIIGYSETKYFKFPKDYFYTIYLGRNENDKGFYEPAVGDLIALANGKPRRVDDLNWPDGSPYLIALVQRVMSEKPNEVQILSSKPITFSGKFVFFAVHLVNLTTNIRIWQALHSKLDGKNMRIIKKVLKNDSNVKCSLCSIEDTKKSASLDLQETISSLNLNESQETAVWSCISGRECHHQATVKLIWGPPGTGKTKTISCLLFALLKINCRTLTCAPTNNAVLEVAARLVSRVTSSLEHDTFGLGDIVLSGNGERMKVNGGFQELIQVFLENRISVLASCLSPTCGWRSKAESMIRLLKYPKQEYDSYLHVGRKQDDKDSNNEVDETRVVTLNVKDRYGKNMGFKEKIPNFTKNKDNMWSFAEFMTKRFNVLEEKLVTMFTNLYTHMPTSFVTLQVAKKMMRIISLIQSIGTLIPGNNGVKDTTTFTEFHAMKMECIQVLNELLHQTVSFPKFTEDREIGNFCLENACLIFCTASSSIQLHPLETNVELLVVDEAAQLRECESFIPLQLSGLRHAVLIGDEMQLPAMVQSKLCEEKKFGRSLFERLVSLKYATHLLDVQYRMHPMISLFPNKKFYGNRILDGPNVTETNYKKQFLEGDMFGSYSFIHLTNGKVEFDGTKSGKNMVEVAVIVELVAKLHTECVAKKQKISVGCITPYKAQVSAIQRKLGDIYGTIEAGECDFSVNVRTVDGFQGCEEDVIIISTVTAIGNVPVGFLSKAQRANVALTRARHCLWILGNGDTLKKSGPVWSQLVLDAKVRRCFYVGNEDETLARVITNTLVELGQFEGLLDMNSLLFKEAKWKVFFSDDFLKSIGDIKNPKTCREVYSLLMKLSGWWRMLQVRNVSQDSALFKISEVNYKGLRLIWSLDILEENTQNVQVLKVWDVLQGTSKLLQLTKRIHQFYRDYNDETLNRCKEKLNEGNLVVPKIWSNVDENGSLSCGIASMSLTREAGSSSSS